MSSDGKLNAAPLGNIEQLPRSGGDFVPVDEDIQPSADNIVHLVIVQCPGEGRIRHFHNPRPQPGALLKGEQVAGIHAVPRPAGVQPVGLVHTQGRDLHRPDPVGPSAQPLQEHLTDHLFQRLPIHGPPPFPSG